MFQRGDFPAEGGPGAWRNQASACTRMCSLQWLPACIQAQAAPAAQQALLLPAQSICNTCKATPQGRAEAVLHLPELAQTERRSPWWPSGANKLEHSLNHCWIAPIWRLPAAAMMPVTQRSRSACSLRNATCLDPFRGAQKVMMEEHHAAGCNLFSSMSQALTRFVQAKGMLRLIQKNGLSDVSSATTTWQESTM